MAYGTVTQGYSGPSEFDPNQAAVESALAYNERKRREEKKGLGLLATSAE